MMFGLVKSTKPGDPSKIAWRSGVLATLCAVPIEAFKASAVALGYTSLPTYKAEPGLGAADAKGKAKENEVIAISMARVSDSPLRTNFRFIARSSWI